MLEALRNLPERDRRALLIGAAGMLLALFWFGVIDPLHGAVERAESRVAAAAGVRERMQVVRGNVARLGGMPQDTGQPLLDRVGRVLQAAGLAPGSYQLAALDAQSVRLSSTQLGYAELMPLVAELVAAHIDVSNARLAASGAGGALRTTLTLVAIR